jgi:hypothetical protein
VLEIGSIESAAASRTVWRLRLTKAAPNQQQHATSQAERVSRLQLRKAATAVNKPFSRLHSPCCIASAEAFNRRTTGSEAFKAKFLSNNYK